MLIVSYALEPRILKTAEYLRETFGIKIYCVEFDYYNNKQKEIFVPKIIGSEDVQRIERANLSKAAKVYQDFFSIILAKLSGKKPELILPRSWPQNWMNLPIGYSGIHLECSFHGKPVDSFEVGLHFERPNAKENEKLLTFFHFKRKEMAEKLKGQIAFL